MSHFDDIWLDFRQTLRGGMKPKGFPVLLYHALSRKGQDIGDKQRELKYWVSDESLRNHLAGIAALGHRVESLDELWTQSDTRQLSEKLAITFDDGHLTDYELAFPLLAAAAAPATFFINTATVMTPGFLTWSQISEMQRHGMSFHSHGHDHVNVALLPDASIKIQLKESKCRIEDHIGRPVRFFAAPFGELTTRVLAISEEVGYDAVCTTRSWPAWPRDKLVSRICMYQQTSTSDLAHLLRLDPLVFVGRTVRSVLLYFPRRLFPQSLMPNAWQHHFRSTL